jgi:hypothetical protein
MFPSIVKGTQPFRLLLVAIAGLLIARCPVCAGEPDPTLVARAQRFLEDETRAKATLNMAHIGARYQGVKTLSWQKVVDRQ